MVSIKEKITLHWSSIKIVLIGIILRLIASLIFTHLHDFFHIIAVTKSVAQTGDLTSSLFSIGDIQLYGKLYYQVIAIWMLLLQHLHLLHISSLYSQNMLPPGNGGYLAHFPWFGPMLYQTVALKLVQFFFDGMLLFFLVKIADILHLPKRTYLLWFWALNPILIYSTYAIYQSDLAMVALLAGGVYFALVALQDDKGRLFSVNKLLSLAFLAIGAVLKQVPILFVPFVIVLFSESMLDFFISCIVFAIVYLLGYQPWAHDIAYIKRDFLISAESTNLFLFQLNGLNIFFFGYIVSFSLFCFFKKKVIQKPVLFIYFVVFIITVILLSEVSGVIFVQFNLWIMPFLALLALDNPAIGIFLFASFLGFLKRSLADELVLSGSLSLFLGEPIAHSPTYFQLLGQMINGDIVSKLFDTSFTASYILLLIVLLRYFFTDSLFPFLMKIHTVCRLNLFRIMLLILLCTGILFGADFIYTSTQYAQLTNYRYTDLDAHGLEYYRVEIPDHFTPVRLGAIPYEFSIDNTRHMTLRGIKFYMYARQLNGDDHLILTVINKDTGKVLSTRKISDAQLPIDLSFYVIRFEKPTNATHLLMSLHEEYGYNDIEFEEAVKGYTPIQEDDFPFYSNFYDKQPIVIHFPQSTYYYMNVMGTYPIKEMISHIGYNIEEKKKFFELYAGVIIIFIGLLFYPFSSVIRGYRSVISYIRYSFVHDMKKFLHYIRKGNK